VIAWAAEMEIFFTRSRPYQKNDQATIESKNHHLVRKYGFSYRYVTPEELPALNRLWRLVNDRLNYLTPTEKPIGYGTGCNGRRARLYDRPATPLERLLAADVPALLTRLAQARTEQLSLTTLPSDLPEVRRGIRTTAVPGFRGHSSARHGQTFAGMFTWGTTLRWLLP
jgi:hypothetical protein